LGASTFAICSGANIESAQENDLVMENEMALHPAGMYLDEQTGVGADHEQVPVAPGPSTR
jgi:hypothetical protein